MTLNLTIINHSGIWQSSDHRLTDPATSKVLDDFSIKHVQFRFPDGSALLAYAGIGRVKSVHLSDWIRETLRGARRTLDESFIAIRENATRDLAPIGMKHMFSIGAFINKRPWAIQIRNFQVVDGVPGPLLDRFETAAREVDENGQGFWYGDPNALTRSDRELLSTVATKTPRRPRDFGSLLASMNRRASETASGSVTVSASCVTTYLPPAGEPFESEFHGSKTAPRELVVPMLVYGFDMTELSKNLPELLSGTGNEEWVRAGREAVNPKNRLRPP